MNSFARLSCRVALGTLTCPIARTSVGAQTPDTTRKSPLDTVKVMGRIDDLRGIATSASEGRVGAADLRSARSRARASCSKRSPE